MCLYCINSGRIILFVHCFTTVEMISCPTTRLCRAFLIFVEVDFSLSWKCKLRKNTQYLVYNLLIVRVALRFHFRSTFFAGRRTHFFLLGPCFARMYLDVLVLWRNLPGGRLNNLNQSRPYNEHMTC